MTTTVTDVQQPGSYPKHQQKLELTPEEIVAFKECLKQRGSSTIVSTLFGAAAGYGIASITPFRAHAKYFALVSGVISMFGSRLNLAQGCLAKVASMPNSTLRDRLAEAGLYGDRTAYRERLQYQGLQPEVQSPAESSTGMVFDDYPPMNTYDTYSSINDDSDFHISEDTDLTEPINLQKGVSYDELRQQNRDDFYKRNKQWYSPRTREPPTARETEQVPVTRSQSPTQEKTKYGDVWD
ncbi:PREDICTED: uncharacterized protein LOC105455420 [Wasmannia auropunctata]|uniref:uncharacterized protein LOC105455420 n=1 Tax=Wasmannia auropunctata TaxID=64793 RepID=UPI0005EFF022|nr:PREDICTED: uncharacterized protein LOC105455420 [Wasmannia auropunctata]